MASQTSQDPLVTQRIIWGAMLASTGVYAYVYLNLHVTDGVEASFVMLPTLGLLAIAFAVASFLLPRSFEKGILGRMSLEVEEIPDPDGSLILGDEAPRIRVFSNPKEARRRALAARFVPLLVSIALSEAIAFFGLTLGVMGFDAVFGFPFLAAGALLIAIRFPTERAALAPLERLLDARFLPDGARAARGPADEARPG